METFVRWVPLSNAMYGSVPLIENPNSDCENWTNGYCVPVLKRKVGFSIWSCILNFFCIKQVSNWELQMACYTNLMPSIRKVVRVIKMLTQNDNNCFFFKHRWTFWSVLLTATASYRLLPEITITKPCEDNLADKLVRCFSEGVIKVENEHGMLKCSYFGILELERRLNELIIYVLLILVVYHLHKLSRWHSCA